MSKTGGQRRASTSRSARRLLTKMVPAWPRDYDEGDIQMIDLDGGERTTIHRGGAAPVATVDRKSVV